MERISIHAEKREETGKGVARSLRRKDMIPAVLYRGGGSLPIKLPKKEITQFINTTAGEQIMVDLQFADGENKLALVKDYQVDPTRRELLHADFFEVLLTEKVRVNVHVVTDGEPIGVKRDAGILQNLLQRDRDRMPAGQDTRTDQDRYIRTRNRTVLSCQRPETGRRDKGSDGSRRSHREYNRTIG